MPLVSKKDKVVNKVLLLNVDDIRTNPNQPRSRYDEEQLNILAQSIKENGLLQPVTVRKNTHGEYELISGERRLRACKLIGKTQIECISVNKSQRESALLALIENIHREDLNIFEQAQALKTLIAKWDVTQDEAAQKLGVAQSTVANKLRLLKLTSTEQRLIIEYDLTERHARALLKINGADKRIEVIKYIYNMGLNVAQTEKYIGSLEAPPAKPKRTPIIKDVRLFVNTINKAIKVMKDAGVPATSKRTEQEGYIEYLVRIPTTDKV